MKLFIKVMAKLFISIVFIFVSGYTVANVFDFYDPYEFFEKKEGDELTQKKAEFNDGYDVTTGAFSITLPLFNVPGKIPFTINHEVALPDNNSSPVLWDIPFIGASILKKEDHITTYWHKGLGCSEIKDYWVTDEHLGSFIHIPGITSAQLYGDAPNDKVVSRNNYKIECGPKRNHLMTNANGDQEVYEQVFYVTTTDGLKYTFSKPLYVSYDEASWRYKGLHPDDGYYGGYEMLAYMLVTRIEDKFGNYINFEYAPDRYIYELEYGLKPVNKEPKKILEKISTSEGVVIDFSKDGTIYSATMNDKTWSVYDSRHIFDSTDGLVEVTRPDGRKWSFSGDFLNISPWRGRYTGGVNIQSCQLSSSTSENPHYQYTASLKTPEGAIYDYSLKATYSGRSQVRGFRQIQASNICASYNAALRSKKLTIADNTIYEWNYEYSENSGGTEAFGGEEPPGDIELPSLLSGIDLKDYKITKITEPDGALSVYLIDRNTKSIAEGKVILVNNYDAQGNLLSVEISEYEIGNKIGVQNWFDPNLNLEYDKRLVKRTLFQNNTEYSIEYSDFNEYESPRLIKESGPSGTKYTKYKFHHDIENWVINQPKSTAISSSNDNFLTIENISYKTITGENEGKSYSVDVPDYLFSYGKWTAHYASYNTNGLIKRIEYNSLLNNRNGNRYIEYSNYKFGTPQIVKYPERILGADDSTDQIVITKEVNDSGQINSETDGNGVATHYRYDELGRILSIDIEDDLTYGHNWKDTLYSWQYPETGGAIRTLFRCELNANRNACLSGTIGFQETETYDRLNRLILITSEDTESYNSSSIRHNNFQYTFFGSVSFESYTSSYSDEYEGKTYTYDALKRLNTVSIDGLGTTSFNYLAGNKVEEIDAENHQTIYTYVAYGTPSYIQASKIESPESVVTDIDIDVFGLINNITQSGPGKDTGTLISQSERHYYDQFKQLCLVKRNDVGSTAYYRNALGEVLWMAEGITGNPLSCLPSQPSESISYSYDNLGALHAVNYTDDSPGIIYNLDANGNIVLLNAGNVLHSYSYNNVNLLESETFTIDDEKSFSLSYGYNDLFHRTSITYPDSIAVNFNPNGFGEPQEAIRNVNSGLGVDGYTYASDAQYHPNGLIDRFTYGNGLVHETRLDSSRLPQNINDSSDTTKALNYSYAYDKNLNLKEFTDHNDSGYSLTNLQYDGLNRLVSSTGNSEIGSSSINYDGLGNITYYQSKNSALDYQYNIVSNTLNSVEGIGSASKNYTLFQYDKRGNVVNNSHREFTFNLANQMVSSGNNSYLYDGHNRRVRSIDITGVSYSIYNMEGSLLYRETPEGGINYIYLGKKLIAKDGVIPKNAGNQHFRPYGKSIEEEIDDAGYTGHKFDKELDLSYMQARYYDPIIGRFLSNDPVGFLGHLDRFQSVQGFNRYAYANNNPYKFTDPDGKSPLAPILAATCILTRCAQNLTEAGLAGIEYATESTGSARKNSRAKRKASRAVQRKKENPRVAVSQPGKNIQGNKFNEDNLRGQEKIGMDGKTKIGIQDGSKDRSNNDTDHRAAVDIGNMKQGEQPGRNGQPRIQNLYKEKEEI
jgi:RHS repeat-associated protein